MADFQFFLNRQGPRGPQGFKGDKGDDGSTPVPRTGTNTPIETTVIFDTGDGNPYETPNLKYPIEDRGGSVVMLDRTNETQYYGTPDQATDNSYGIVKLATPESVLDDPLDNDVVTYELFNDNNQTIKTVTDGLAGDITQLNTDLGAEVTNRTNADAQLTNKINTDIGNEATARSNADTALSGRIDNLTNVKANKSDVYTKTQTDSLLNNKSNVGHTHNYNEITNKPSIGNGTITFKQGNATVGTITTNQSINSTLTFADPTGVTAGTGLDLDSSTDTLSVKIDNDTLGINSNGEIEVQNAGTTYSEGNAIDLTNDTISVKYDNNTLGVNASGELYALSGGITQNEVEVGLIYRTEDASTKFTGLNSDGTGDTRKVNMKLKGSSISVKIDNVDFTGTSQELLTSICANGYIEVPLKSKWLMFQSYYQPIYNRKSIAFLGLYSGNIFIPKIIIWEEDNTTNGYAHFTNCDYWDGESLDDAMITGTHYTYFYNPDEKYIYYNTGTSSGDAYWSNQKSFAATSVSNDIANLVNECTHLRYVGCKNYSDYGAIPTTYKYKNYPRVKNPKTITFENGIPQAMTAANSVPYIYDYNYPEGLSVGYNYETLRVNSDNELYVIPPSNMVKTDNINQTIQGVKTFKPTDSSSYYSFNGTEFSIANSNQIYITNYVANAAQTYTDWVRGSSSLIIGVQSSGPYICTNNNSKIYKLQYSSDSGSTNFLLEKDMLDGTTISYDSNTGKISANVPTPVTVDQTYDATSTNAQSGVAIAGAGFINSSIIQNPLQYLPDTTDGLTYQNIDTSTMIGSSLTISVTGQYDSYPDYNVKDSSSNTYDLRSYPEKINLSNYCWFETRLNNGLNIGFKGNSYGNSGSPPAFFYALGHYENDTFILDACIQAGYAGAAITVIDGNNPSQTFLHSGGYGVDTGWSIGGCSLNNYTLYMRTQNYRQTITISESAKQILDNITHIRVFRGTRHGGDTSTLSLSDIRVINPTLGQNDCGYSMNSTIFDTYDNIFDAHPASLSLKYDSNTLGVNASNELYALSSIPSNMVTTDSDQTINSNKTFSNKYVYFLDSTGSWSGQVIIAGGGQIQVGRNSSYLTWDTPSTSAHQFSNGAQNILYSYGTSANDAGVVFGGGWRLYRCNSVQTAYYGPDQTTYPYIPYLDSEMLDGTYLKWDSSTKKITVDIQAIKDAIDALSGGSGTAQQGGLEDGGWL